MYDTVLVDLHRESDVEQARYNLQQWSTGGSAPLPDLSPDQIIALRLALIESMLQLNLSTIVSSRRSVASEIRVPIGDYAKAISEHIRAIYKIITRVGKTGCEDGNLIAVQDHLAMICRIKEASFTEQPLQSVIGVTS